MEWKADGTKRLGTGDEFATKGSYLYQNKRKFKKNTFYFVPFSTAGQFHFLSFSFLLEINIQSTPDNSNLQGK